MKDKNDKLVSEIKKANNILIALNSNPTVDELTSAMGLTLMLNKNKRRAVSIFSGETPNVIKFLKPEEIFDRNVDGLRDFIVTLNSDKADRVVVKLDDGVVKVFITPNNTIISKNDLGYEQGEYNVDMVIALGVKNKDSLDKALSSHGRILSNAFVASVSVDQDSSSLGNLDITLPNYSSYAQFVADLPQLIDEGEHDDDYEMAMDDAVATALLTAIVSTTNRFSNNKTTPEIMSLVSDLMKVGANQQRVVGEIEQAEKELDLRENNISDNKTTSENVKKSNQESKKDNQVIDLKQKVSSKNKAPFKPTKSDVSKPKENESLNKDNEFEKELSEPTITDVNVEPTVKVKSDFSNIDEYVENRKQVEEEKVVDQILDKVNDLEAAKNSKQNQSSDIESEKLEQQLGQITQSNQPANFNSSINNQLSNIQSEPGLAPESQPEYTSLADVDPTINEVASQPQVQAEPHVQTQPQFDQTPQFNQAPDYQQPQFDSMMPPALPDFSNMMQGQSGFPPLPPEFPVMPQFDAPQAAPMQPQSQIQSQPQPQFDQAPQDIYAQVNNLADSVALSEQNPFNQFASEAKSVPENPPYSQPYQPAPQTSPIMAEQIYPAAPSEPDPGQFQIPQ